MMTTQTVYVIGTANPKGRKFYCGAKSKEFIWRSVNGFKSHSPVFYTRRSNAQRRVNEILDAEEFIWRSVNGFKTQSPGFSNMKIFQIDLE